MFKCLFSIVFIVMYILKKAVTIRKAKRQKEKKLLVYTIF